MMTSSLGVPGPPMPGTEMGTPQGGGGAGGLGGLAGLGGGLGGLGHL